MCLGTRFYVLNEIIIRSVVYPFLNELHSMGRRDSLAVQMENQNNGDAIEPTAPSSSNSGSSSDDGKPPHFMRANDLPEFIFKPSGNTVKIKCPTAGKQTECERDKFLFIISNK